ncbi:MAG TPA: ComEC/Rec2 family competence protein, partial [Ideonella sp.]|nr:ComEC/Rec2 family competence protein [Ideonella sp.]
MSASGGTVIAAAALAWMAGVGLQLQQPELWAVGAYGQLGLAALGCLASAGVAARLAGRHRVAGATALASLCAACALLGFASTGWRAGGRVAQILSAELEGRDLVLTGRVVQMPQIDEDGLRFVFDVASARTAGAGGVAVRVPPRVWLGWSRGWQEGALVAGPPSPLRAGERWQLPVRLKQPHGVLNPGGFDSELWLFEQGMGGVGQVRATAPSDPQRLSGARWWALGEQIEALRQRLRDAILLRPGGDARSTGVLAALAVGDQSAVDSAGWDLFRSTSTAHLVVVSGMHITLFAWLAAGLLGWAWRRSLRLVHWVATPIAQRWGGLLLATLYALLAGWGVPAQRTTLMLGLTVLLRGAGLNWPASLICVVAGAVVIAVDPWALLQPGFWLSFVAVLMLIASEPAR